MNSTIDHDKAVSALQHLSPSMAREDWYRVCAAARAAEIPYDTFNEWSAGGDSYSASDCRSTWNSLPPQAGGIGAATLFGMAKREGWKSSSKPSKSAPAKAAKPAAPAPELPQPSPEAQAIWSRASPLTLAHPYCRAKKLTDPAAVAGLRVLADTDGLVLDNIVMAGAAVLPLYRPGTGELQSVQCIALDGQKRTRGKMADAYFTLGAIEPGQPAYVVEGIGAAWAVWQATGSPATVTCGVSRTETVAAAVKAHNPDAKIVLAPDAGQELSAEKVAQHLDCAVVALPGDWPKNSDAWDFLQVHGHGALAGVLEGAAVHSVNEAAPAPLPIGIVFADQLGDAYSPPDELVQGLLTMGDGAMLYGDSNSGKTFFAIDLACAVARGVDWHGRKVEPGLVMYVASESPGSVRGRLQAYQQHHRCKVPNFAIVQNPIDLFSDDVDTQALIDAAKQLERMAGQPVRLIVGDTLARLSAGANENSGQDMGLVVQRFDRIRRETGAHFLMIHHSGKAAAAGARGWSGIRAAVDTEIEVTDSPSGRCAEITKQRDLSTKGERIGFRLEAVTLGATKWGAPATSCAVVPSDAPDKPQGKRTSEVCGAVLEYLRTQPAGKKKREVVEHFQPLYDKSAVYRELKKLVTAGQVLECIGIVTAHVEVRNGAK